MSFYEFPHTRTYDTDIGWLIKHCKTMEEAISAIEAWIKNTQPTIDNLEELYKAITSGNLPPAMRDGIMKWCRENLLELVAQTLKTVIFGLTDDGHFVAYISDSWRDIIFNTTEYDIVTPINREYGHLTLSLRGGI